MVIRRAAIKTEHCVFLGVGGEYALSYLSNNDPSSWGVDAEGQMSRFVAKTLRVCSGLVVLAYCTWGQGLLLLLLER